MPQYFPDRSVKKEIDDLEVKCASCSHGCNWTGKFQQYQLHVQGCEFQAPHDVQRFICTVSAPNSPIGPPSDIQCDNCYAFIRSCEFAVHQERCLALSQGRQCPLLTLGCPNECHMDQSELSQHVQECQYDHLALLVDRIQKVESMMTQHSSLESMDTQIHTQAQDMHRDCCKRK